MTNEINHVAVVGAGHGGTAVAALLRQHGFPGHITLIGSETHQPYHRPPLSKSTTVGESISAELLRPDEFYTTQDIDLRLGTHVERVDTDRSVLQLAGGDVVQYDAMVLATGARALQLRLPGADLPQVRTLRTFDDALWLHDALMPGNHLVVVGAGYVGLEVAALARSRGASVTVIEGAPRVLGRSAGADVAEWLTRYHRSRGTEIILNAAVGGFVADESGNLASVQLEDRQIDCDLVVVGVGAEPCDDLALSAGLSCDRGVIVDDRGRTSVPHIYAIGDMTRRPLPPYEGLFRLESIPSASEQAKQVTADILGLPAPQPEVPWFWSDQYDLKLQIAGMPAHGEKPVVRGDIDTGRFAIYHLDGADRVVAVEAMNSPGDFLAGKKFIANQMTINARDLSDTQTSLKDLMRRGNE
jgi:3-phenylpropionate/trans-cinnamate dioxygenase ferredoxin reductase subunit